MAVNPAVRNPADPSRDNNRLNDAFAEIQAGQSAAAGARTSEEKQDILGQYSGRAEDLGGSKNAGVVRSASGGGDSTAPVAEAAGQEGAQGGKGGFDLAGTLGKAAGIALIATDVIAVVGIVAAPFTAGGSLALSAGALAAKQGIRAGMRQGMKKSLTEGAKQGGRKGFGSRFSKNMLGVDAKYGLVAGVKRIFGMGGKKKAAGQVAKRSTAPVAKKGAKAGASKPNMLTRVGRGIKNTVKRVGRAIRRNVVDILRGVMKAAAMYFGMMAATAGAGSKAGSHGGKINASVSGLNSAKMRKQEAGRSPAMGQSTSKMGLRAAPPEADKVKINAGKEMQQNNERSNRESNKKDKGGRGR